MIGRDWRMTERDIEGSTSSGHDRKAVRSGSHWRVATATTVIVTEDLGTDVILVSGVEAARVLSISIAEMVRLRRNGELVAWRNGRRLPLVSSELQCSAGRRPRTNKCSKNVGGAL